MCWLSVGLKLLELFDLGLGLRLVLQISIRNLLFSWKVFVFLEVR